MKRILAVTLGDPAGIGPEIVCRALKKYRPRGIRWLVVGDQRVFHRARNRFTPGLRVPPLIPGGAGTVRALTARPPSAAAGRSAFNAVSLAIDLALEGAVRGIVTAPISKEALHMAGHEYSGHTEILAERCRGAKPVMAFFGGPVPVALATVHVPLRRVPRLLTAERIVHAARALEQGLKQHLKKRRPRLAVAGLNPHAGEGGLFGGEEGRIVAPAVRRLNRMGVKASGPVPPDTVFRRAKLGEFDGVVALYHDQGLIPVKLDAFSEAVNVTLGLPFIRTSPDHGTAFDIAWKGKADPACMIAAMRLAVQSS